MERQNAVRLCLQERWKEKNMSTEVLKKERNNEIFFEFPVPLSPSFARMDLSDYPALIGAFALGPVCGVLAEFVKNALQMQ